MAITTIVIPFPVSVAQAALQKLASELQRHSKFENLGSLRNTSATRRIGYKTSTGYGVKVMTVSTWAPGLRCRVVLKDDAQEPGRTHWKPFSLQLRCRDDSGARWVTIRCNEEDFEYVEWLAFARAALAVGRGFFATEAEVKKVVDGLLGRLDANTTAVAVKSTTRYDESRDDVFAQELTFDSACSEDFIDEHGGLR